MKHLLLLAFAIILLFSCSDIETNNPAFQGSIDNIQFKATSSRAIQNDDGSFSIQGVTVDETMTLMISNNIEGTYVFGGASSNYATLENTLGITYNTSPEGMGQVIITSSDAASKLVSGTFNFTALVPGIDTIRVHNGVFYEIRYTGEDGGGDGPFDGTMSAVIDESPFSPLNVVAVETGNSIKIVGIGSGGSRTITIEVPVDVEAGSFELPENEFLVNYTFNSIEEEALSGTIVITAHNIGVKTLSGTFSFETENHTIELGQFNVTYQ